MTQLLAACLAFLAWLAPAVAAPRAADLVRAELVAEPAAVVPGRPFTVGVRLLMKANWHTYWRNPGDSGLGTEIKWTLPAGASAGPILWPAPERIPVSHLVNYGYSHEVVLLTEITPPADLALREMPIKADVTYLVCERECIPGEASLSLTLPVAPQGSAVAPSGTGASIIAAAREKLPSASPWRVRVGGDADTLRLRIEAPGLRHERVRSAQFFPYDETAIEHAAPQPAAFDASGLTITLKRSALATGPVPADLDGILTIEEALDSGVASRQSFAIGREPAATSFPAASTSPAPPDLSPLAIATAALAAFLGGIVLNLMPCVFPVLSIKVLSLVKHSGYGPALVRLNGLAYAAGVLASFLALAGLLLAIRAGGAEIGWGFQLQSPAVVVAIAFLLFAMGLSLSGAFTIGTGLAAAGARLDGGSGLPGSFATGILATIVATPCTAPFMGAAVGYALTAPAPVTLAVFAALALGLAAPFLLLTLVPGLVRALPRPGGWMELLKQILAFPLYATVAWLVFVLSQQVGPTGLFAALLGLVAVGFGAWAFRQAGEARSWGRPVGYAAVAASLVGLVALGVAIDRERSGAPAQTAAAAGDWEPFTQARLDSLRAEGRAVFVNMTAAWCITCLVNERTALSTDGVRAAFKARNIAYLKGDWTNQNPEITRLLERHGRSGVPLYVLYPPRGEPTVLPQILTQSAVIDSLALVGETRRAEIPSTHRQE